ncbi:histone-lysine N-methyltransferase SETMAR [Trichonephila clavipes]|nr:histone-lysine N-methyltransferase SETMAR [Trichonephila clavipes]
MNHFDVWVPRKVTEKYLMDRISICDSLYKRKEETHFLKQRVTGDEKWIIYNNVERKRSWGKWNRIAFSQSESMSSIEEGHALLGDCKEILHHELT